MSADPDTTTTTARVSEREAREVAEQAREDTWRKPSFDKGTSTSRRSMSIIASPAS